MFVKMKAAKFGGSNVLVSNAFQNTESNVVEDRDGNT
jgi:hypothetical protein